MKRAPKSTRENKKASARTVKGESMLPRYHLDLHADCSVCISVIRYRGSGGRLDAGCSEVAVFRAAQGLAPSVLSLWNGRRKLVSSSHFQYLLIYYDTNLSCCQQGRREKISRELTKRGQFFPRSGLYMKGYLRKGGGSHEHSVQRSAGGELPRGLAPAVRHLLSRYSFYRE